MQLSLLIPSASLFGMVAFCHEQRGRIKVNDGDGQDITPAF